MNSALKLFWFLAFLVASTVNNFVFAQDQKSQHTYVKLNNHSTADFKTAIGLLNSAEGIEVTERLDPMIWFSYNSESMRAAAIALLQHNSISFETNEAANKVEVAPHNKLLGETPPHAPPHISMQSRGGSYNNPGGTISTCGGMFYDTGGPTGNYANNQNIVTTFCPDITGTCVSITFTSFSTESCCDYLRIYDGPNTSAPLIGQYQGTAGPGTVTASDANPSGCLTFQFYSDFSVVSAGWTANISCGTCAPDPNPPITTCSANFYDTGGPGGNYGNNQNYTVTYCPDSSDECIQAAFSSFATENCCDYLRIYDGPNTSAPLIGQYQGANNPGIVLGSVANASGCLTFEFFSDGSITAAGWAAAISCQTCGPDPNAPITTCSDTFYDTGGPGGNYGNNENYTVTYCPNSPDECIQAVFTSFATENCCDYLRIYDGPNTSAPLFGQFQGATSPGSIGGSISNASGCLTFEFFSDGSITSSGWAANISCGECGTTPPPPPSPPLNCIDGVTVCSDETFTGNSSGSGSINDLNSSNQGCLGSGENQSAWYLFSPATDGQIGFTISPGAGVDYDFAVWGPYPEGSTAADLCPPSGLPIRCSYISGLGSFFATGSYDTGIGHPTYSVPQYASPLITYTDGTGNAFNGWVPGLNVTAGEVYILIIDNFSSNSTPFSLNWNLQNGASLDCTPLPVELLELTGNREANHNVLRWKTASETNSDYFEIQRSNDGFDYIPIGSINAAGFSSSTQSYVYRDEFPTARRHYYRLKQVDFDGVFEYLGPVVIDSQTNEPQFGDPYPNPTENGMAHLDVNFPHAALITTTIFDATGRPMSQNSHSIARGVQAIRIDLTALAPGIYYVRFSDDSGILHVAHIIR